MLFKVLAECDCRSAKRFAHQEYRQKMVECSSVPQQDLQSRASRSLMFFLTAGVFRMEAPIARKRCSSSVIHPPIRARHPI